MKSPKCCIQKLNHDFLSNLHQGAILNEYQVWKKISQNATMGVLWGRSHYNFLDSRIFTKTNLHME
jgi:hypothetical protein